MDYFPIPLLVGYVRNELKCLPSIQTNVQTVGEANNHPYVRGLFTVPQPLAAYMWKFLPLA